MSYNGHTNWATWNVCIYIDNDYDTYKAYMRLSVRRPWTGRMAKDWVHSIFPHGTPDMDSSLDFLEVDWDSVAEHMNADVSNA